MALLATSQKRYVGGGADIKPTPAEVGARYTDRDSGVEWIFDGCCWIRIAGMADDKLAAALATANVLLESILEQLVMMQDV